MTWPLKVPGPDQLAETPELAALEMLDAALLVATNALIAQNGDLGFADLMAERPSASALLADAIVNHIDGLQHAINRYRDQLLAAQALRSMLPEPDF